jgi:hypothetical protein
VGVSPILGDAEEVILLQEGRRRGRKVSFCAIDLTVAIYTTTITIDTFIRHPLIDATIFID